MGAAGYAALALLAVSILSFGLSDAAYAQQTVRPLSVETDKSEYSSGDTVLVSGTVAQLNSHYQIAMQVILDTNGPKIIEIAQINPVPSGEGGTFSKSISTGGFQWRESGEYKILVAYGPQMAETAFSFSAVDTAPPPVVAPEPPEPQEPEQPEPEVVEPEPVEPEPVEPEPVEPEPVEPEPVEPEPVVTEPEPAPEAEPSGCLIATAAYGSELASQVQFLREIREGTLMSTSSGTAFMTSHLTTFTTRSRLPWQTLSARARSSGRLSGLQSRRCSPPCP